MDKETRKKRTAYMREWRKRNPERDKASKTKYYLKNKDRFREYQKQRVRNRTPEEREVINRKLRIKYATDPEHRKRMSESWKKWYNKNKGNLSKRSTLQPFTTGLECGFCGLGIKTHIGGRLGKGLIKCPECKCEQQRNWLRKVKIPRYITVFPVNETKIPPPPREPSKSVSESKKPPQKAERRR